MTVSKQVASVRDGLRRASRSPVASAAVALPLALVLATCGGGGSGSTGGSGGSSGGGGLDDIPGSRPERITLLLEELGNRVVVPRYAAMSRAFTALEEATSGFCAAPSSAGLGAARAAWRAAIGAWLEASIIQFGPIRDDNRRLRIEFWPDGNNNVRRSVQQILARDDALDAATLASQSVAGQGLPALEQLLFEPDADVLAAFTTEARAPRRCAYATAIAGNLQRIGAAVESEWRRSEGGWVDQLARAGRGSDAFPDRDAAVEEVVNSLVTVVEVTKNNRIGDPLGGDAVTEAKPFRAESFASGNSLANVVHAVRGLEAVYSGDGGFFGFDDYLRALESLRLNREILDEMETVVELADAIPAPLAGAVQDEMLRPRVVELFDHATTLTRLLKNQLPQVMQVTVGFNENDGD
ncbi:MAG: imelysin family protein [Thermodesulfobacteriota bacterium]